MARILAAVLVIGSAASMPLFKMAGLTFTGDRILGVLAVVIISVRALRAGIRWTPVHLALAAFVAVQVFTTLLNASAWPRGMLLVTVYLLGFACFTLTADIASSAAVRGFTARLLIAVSAVVGLVAGLLAAAGNLWSTPLWGTFALPTNTRGGPIIIAARGIFLEQNFLGSFLVIAFTLYLWQARERVLPPLFGIVAGIVFSFTRASWFGMGGIVLAAVRMGGLTRRMMVSVLGVIVLFFALLLVTAGPDAFLDRTALPVRTGHDVTVAYRTMVSEVMLRSWLERPLVGHGAGAGDRLTLTLPSGRVMGQLWAGNVEVHLLQNSGLLGLAAFLLVIGVVWRSVRGAIRRRDEQWTTLGAPLTVAGVFLLFAFQFTHALWLMFPYVYLGLFAAELHASEESR